ncbi:MAG: prephenate dehydrogenase/arogenate dehydrogenase family protein, partial [Polyangiaceae bacterium]|nr:prephenate dehydrogenase/arogenate dehydrogenase family protein [Polyangiaceae bacterium]
MNDKRTFGFVGGGNMAAALIRGLLGANVPQKCIIVSDVKAERTAALHAEHGVRVTADNRALVKESDIVVIAVKPQVIDRVLDALAGDLRPEHLVISVAAGVPIKAIEGRLPPKTRVVRAMPN